MEESTEPHMETDVSSTTVDVPDTQEVTGSDGNVEMIIVVEKMDDEPSADEEQLLLSSEETSNASAPEEKQSRDKESEVLKCPEKSAVGTQNKSAINSPVKSVNNVQTKSPIHSPTKSAINTQTRSPINSPAKSAINIEAKSAANSPVKSANSPAKSATSPAKSAISPAKTAMSAINTKSNSPAKTPTKSPSKSPNNNIEVPTSLSNPETEQVIVVVQPEPQSEDLPSVQTQIEAADSSINEPLPIQFEDTLTDIEKSSEKDVQKLVEKSPLKEQQSQDSVNHTQTKESLQVDKPPVNGKVQSNDTGKKDDSGTKNLTTVINPIDITIETSNDSQIETLSDISEKEHKSISRELKSLINSAKESKIISECTQLTSKTRKSRTALDISSSSLNSSLVEPNKIHETRRNSDISQKSNCSEKSDKTVLKRSMRSQNPEFVSKVKQFLNSVTGKGHKDSEEEGEEMEERVSKADLNDASKPTPPKVKKVEEIVTEKSNKLRSDSYCWRCHWAIEQVTNEKVHPPMHCTVCPRSFHYKCLSGVERNKINVEKNWVCPECMIVLQAESSETRSPAMNKITLGMLCDLLRHALERMMDLNGVEPFLQPVDRAAFPDYDKYVVHPMDLSLMQDNIAEKLYGSTEAFLADAQWILHNSIIFNTLQSKLTSGARALVRSCRAEMGEIEACPECYAAAHARRPTWFTDVCSTPHILFWAKLKGFPYWPAKGMSVNSAGLVDVRFFGAHDRAWVPAKDCFLYSEKDPNNFRTKRQDIIDSMQEAEQHIRNISRKYGKFIYPPFKTQFDPTKMHEQLKMMIPTFEGEVRSLVKEKAAPAAGKEKIRSNSKSSKSSAIDESSAVHSDSSDTDGEELQRLYTLLQKSSDISENEDTPTVALRKMADGAEIAKMEEDDSMTDKDAMDVDTPPNKTKEESLSSTSSTSSRKRRRSELEEAVVTIIESSGINSSSFNEKRKRMEEDKTEPKKPAVVEPSSSKADDTSLNDKPKESVKDTQAKAEQTPPVTPKQKLKDGEPSSITEKEKNLRVTPIRIALVTKDKRNSTRKSTSKEPTAKIISPSEDKDEKSTPKRQKPKTDKVDKTPTTKVDKVDKTPSTKVDKVDKTSTTKVDKTSTTKADKTPTTKTSSLKAEKGDKTPSDKTNKEDRSRSEKRRNSRGNRSTNSVSSTRSSDKSDKRSEKSSESPNKEKDSTSNKEKVTDEKLKADKQSTPKPASESVTPPKSVKDRLQFDDDTTLAVLARESSKSITNNISGLPTISCVRSLSTTAQNTSATLTKTTTVANTIDITEEANSDSSIFTPTSIENVKTMKDAATKLQKLRNDAEPVVGRVGVRAFARMTSPDRQNENEDVQVEIKAEPIDLDEPERHMEKMDLMNAFRLRPVNPNPPTNLRDVRINKVVVTPLNARKGVGKPLEIRPRAKKTFPQPKKADDGRSELNSKNSMVYIPIQPPITQAPVRLPRPQHTAPPTVTSVLRPPAPVVTSVSNNLVNTVTTPLMQVSSSAASSSCGPSTSSSVATVPTVHTVPLMTSVNGQWMFSFQPVMSVGAIDSSSPSPLMNGVPERGAALTGLGGALPALPAAPPALPALPALPTAPIITGPAPPITVISRTPTENTPGEPPRLQQRPTGLLNPLDANTPIGSMPPPSTAGPITAKLNQNAVKMTDFFRTLLEDSIEKLEEPSSLLTTLKLQLEQATWRHQQEIKEVKHNHELTLAEMRASFEKEKLRAVSEARRTAQVELEGAVKLAKSKQWCANCSQEAQFYCCWNTSYCDYPCQRAHWSQHFAVCQQRSQDGSNGDPPSSPENRLQPQPDMPKNTPAPTLTVGGKVAPTRVYAQDSHNTQKASIIVSMVEDTTGNQTMKCLGTYKPPSTGQIAPIIINKQLMNNEESLNKKVVSSSGGYLIVGASNNSSVVTPARRTHTIQYYT